MGMRIWVSVLGVLILVISPTSQQSTRSHGVNSRLRRTGLRSPVSPPSNLPAQRKLTGNNGMHPRFLAFLTHPPVNRSTSEAIPSSINSNPLPLPPYRPSPLHPEDPTISALLMGRELAVAADAAAVEVVEEGCTTPTAAEYRIPETVACPPAPRKKRSCPVPGGAPAAGAKKFFVPPNLDAVFAVYKAY